MAWEWYLTDEVDAWLTALATSDRESYALVVAGIEVLAEVGPNLGRPLVDRIKGSSLHNLKELRPGSAGSGELRVLFTFDPWRSAIPLSPETSPATGRAGTGKRSHEPKSCTPNTCKTAPKRKGPDDGAEEVVRRARPAHPGSRPRSGGS